MSSKGTPPPLSEEPNVARLPPQPGGRHLARPEGRVPRRGRAQHGARPGGPRAGPTPSRPPRPRATPRSRPGRRAGGRRRCRTGTRDAARRAARPASPRHEGENGWPDSTRRASPARPTGTGCRGRAAGRRSPSRPGSPPRAPPGRALRSPAGQDAANRHSGPPPPSWRGRYRLARGGQTGALDWLHHDGARASGEAHV